MKIINSALDQEPSKRSERTSWITFKGTGLHRVKILSAEEGRKKNFKTGIEEDGFFLTFEEDGENKKYFIKKYGKEGKFSYLAERFANIPEGSELIIEYKKKQGSYEGFLDVKFAPKDDEVQGEEEIPIYE